MGLISSYAVHLHWLSRSPPWSWEGQAVLETDLCCTGVVNQDRQDKFPNEIPGSLKGNLIDVGRINFQIIRTSELIPTPGMCLGSKELLKQFSSAGDRSAN